MLSRGAGRAAGLLLLPLAGLLVGQAQADLMYTYSQAQTCGIAIYDVVGDMKWPGPLYKSYYGSICTNPNALVTLYANMQFYCKGQDIQGSVDVLAGRCKAYAEIDIVPAETFAANLTEDAIAALPVLSRKQAMKMVNATAPFLCDQDWFDLSYKTDDQWGKEERSHAWYTMAIYCFWCIILGTGMIRNAINKVVEGRRGYVYVDAEGLESAAPVAGRSLVSRCYALVRKYVTTPSALPPYHSQRLFGCTIPTRAESFVVLSFWIINIVLGAVSYSAFKGNLYWSNPSVQLWRYVADRTGIMSYGNIPLLYMFSGRNNIFLLLTGWSFGTFNIFHRHIARIATLQAIVHSIAYTGFYYTNGKGAAYRADYKELWFALGVAATVVMSFIIFFSFSIFRAKLYENFLLMHIVLSVLLIAFLWYHTSIFEIKQYNYPFLVSAAVVWGFDRLLRLVRQAYINLHVRRRRGTDSMLFTETTVTYHADADMLVVDAVPANAHLFPGPGQHYYLYQPLRFLGWENHPFTLAHWTTTSGADGKAGSGDLHLQFWVRPVNGWTRTLRKACERQGKAGGGGGGGSVAMPSLATKMLLEGPYGKREPIHTFEEVLLIAGGSGIAGVLPYLLDFVRRKDAKPSASATGDAVVPTRTRRITLIWADRREAFLRVVADGVLAELMDHPHLCIQLHQTSLPAAGAGASTALSSTEAVQTAASGSSSDAGGEDKGACVSVAGDAEKKTLPGTKAAYRIHAGRPDVLTSVQHMAEAVRDTRARLAVMVCGPSALADSVRSVVARNMETSRDGMEYFEESFGW